MIDVLVRTQAGIWRRKSLGKFGLGGGKGCGANEGIAIEPMYFGVRCDMQSAPIAGMEGRLWVKTKPCDLSR